MNLNPLPLFEAVTKAYGRTTFKPVAAYRTVEWRWHMPEGHRFIIHDSPKPEEKKDEQTSAGA